FVDARNHLELGGGLYDEEDRVGFASWGVDAPALAAIVVLVLGFPARACELMNEAWRRAERRAEPFRMGMVHMWGGAMRALLRDAPATLEHAHGLRRLAARQPAWTGLADGYTGEALIIQRKWQEAIGYLRQAMAFHKALGAGGMLLWTKLDEAEFF